MSRKILTSLLALGLSGAALGGVGTFAAFSDAETSRANNLATGTLNLRVGRINGDSCVGYGNDPTVPLVLNAANAAPGEVVIGTACLWNTGSLAGNAAMSVLNPLDVEVSCNDPEELAEGGDGISGGATDPYDCGTTGELLGVTVADMWQDANCDRIFDDEEALLFTGLLADAAPSPLGVLAGGGKACVSVALSVPVTTGNAIQGDALSFDLHFTLDQAL